MHLTRDSGILSTQEIESLMLRGGRRQDQKLKSGKVYQILRIWTKKRSKPNGQRERVCWAHPEAGVRASRRVTHERGHTTVSWGEPAYSLPCFKFVCVWLWGRGVAVKWSQSHRPHEDISADRDEMPNCFANATALLVAEPVAAAMSLSFSFPPASQSLTIA